MTKLNYAQQYALNEAVFYSAVTRAINQANGWDSIMQKIIPTPDYSRLSASPKQG